jgi:L-fuconolactonase
MSARTGADFPTLGAVTAQQNNLLGETVLDSHLHFWDTGHLDYPWLSANPQLDRPFRPADLAAAGASAEAMVVVQADCRWSQAQAEVAWFRSLAEQGAPIHGIVAALPLELGPACAPALRTLAQEPLVVGVRRLLQDEAPGFALQPDFVAGVRQLAGYGLVADLCVRHHQLPEVTELVEQCPEVTFVLDHLGKPDVAAGGHHPWAADLSRLAARPNVRCKLSGLTTEADDATRTFAHIAPFLRHAIDVFGPGRCLFGSDWPVASLTVSYPGWLDIVTEAVQDLTHAERSLIMRGTATAVYRRPTGPGDQPMGESC